MKYPKVYLAIDNCFAFKRWTRPMDWAKVIKDIGVNYVEASADTELDPLFMGEEYLERWVDDVKEAENAAGIKVANLYSGHGTYCTLGLTHTDENVRNRIKNKWFKPLIKLAAQVNAGIGFFAHAFSDFVLQDKDLYHQYVQTLYDNLAELNEYAKQVGCGDLGVEQMYSPHQVPWRIEGTKELLKQVTQRSNRSFYFTEDIGHHHIKFITPSKEDIRNAFKAFKNDNMLRGLWLGMNKTYQLFKEADSNNGEISETDLNEITREIEQYPHMFAKEEDGDCYEWLRRLGCYSPIIHLQQSDGLTSAHKHFTRENNQWGKIEPKAVLTALRESYDQAEDSNMPKRCEKIYLTLEAFTSTASINHDTLEDYKLSVDYWRKYISEDGMELNKLV